MMGEQAVALAKNVEYTSAGRTFARIIPVSLLHRFIASSLLQHRLTIHKTCLGTPCLCSLYGVPN